MNDCTLENPEQATQLRILQPIPYWIGASSAVVVPILAFIGFIEGKGDQAIYAGLSDSAYSVVAYFSWLPFVLAAVVVEVLRFNTGWLEGLHHCAANAELPSTGLRRTVVLLNAALWPCAWLIGSVVGQVWAVRDVLSGIFVVMGICALLAYLYRYVVFADHDFEQGNVVDGGAPASFAASSDAAVQQVTAMQQSGDRSLTQGGMHGEDDDEFESPHGALDRVPVQTRPTEYDFPWERPTSGFEGLAGMQQLKDELETTIKRFSHYKQMQHCQDAAQSEIVQGIRREIADQNGILLSGPPGNGKTAFASAIAAELDLPFVKIGCGDLTSKWVNESPKVIKELFLQASKQPCVLFFDEFDGVALSRANGNMHGEDRKVVNALLSEIDGARSKPIVLIAATNFGELIDPAIARPGRFDFAIEIPYPDAQARQAIIRTLLDKHYLIVDCVTLERVVKLWERRSVAFIDSAVKRIRESMSERGDFRVCMEDFKLAARAACRMASAIPGDGQKLSEIALASSVRRDAKSLLYRMRCWEEIADKGGETPTGVMLYGPPGTGKSMFVRALARELGDWHVFEVHAGEISQNARVFRQTVELAQTHRPAIIFLDEADELLAHRSGSWNASATNEILKCMDGFAGRVPEILFVAATNRLEAVDPAALRGGRFSEKIHMDLLRNDDLVAFVQTLLHSQSLVCFAPDVNAESIATLCGEASPAEVISLMKKVVNYSFGDEGQTGTLSMQDFRTVHTLTAALEPVPAHLDALMH